jgi:hypothetical protein
MSAAAGFPDAPAGPGQLVAVVPLNAYSLERDLTQTSVGTCPPTSPDSAICGEYPEYGFPSGITVWSGYHGGLAGSGAYFFARYDLSGYVDPNKEYIVRMLGRKLGGASVHISGIRVGNDGSANAGGGSSLSGSWVYHDFDVTSGPASELTADVGGFDMTVGAAILTGLAFLAIYDPDLPTSGTPGIPSTQFNRTSFRRKVTFDGETYTACEIEHTEPTTGVDDAPGTIQISLPSDDPIAQEFRKSILPPRPMVQIYQYHRPPTDNPDPANVWSMLYDIVDTEHTPDQTTLTCASILGQMTMIIPSGLVQRDYCIWTTYDPLTCGVNPASFTFTGVVASISGAIVEVTDAGAYDAPLDPDPNVFRLGSLSFGVYSSMIREQNGDFMTLDDPIPGLVVGDSVSLLVGDDRTERTCALRFLNSERRASFPKMPVSNPWYGRGLAP